MVMFRLAICFFLFHSLLSCSPFPDLGELYREAAVTGDYSRIGAYYEQQALKEERKARLEPPKVICERGKPFFQNRGSRLAPDWSFLGCYNVSL